MIKKLLITGLLACTIAIQAQQVQNPGFENWTGAYPTSWGSYSEMLAGIGFPGAGLETKSSNFNSGSFSVLLENKAVAALGGQIVPGFVNTGPVTYDLTNSKVVQGRQAYSTQATSYSFFSIYTPTLTDSAYSQVFLTKWNGTSRDTVAFGFTVFPVGNATYMQTTVPINYLIMTAPDSIQLLFISSIKGTPPAGSQFFVDDVNMISSMGVQSLNADGTFSNVYPNPAVNTITFATNDEKAKYAKVYDLTGRAVTTIELTGKITKADISSFENGLYIYVITDADNNKISTSKFNVSK